VTPSAPRRRWRPLRDPRVWFGLAVTALFLWLALRGVPFAQVAEAIAGARWGILIAVSVPGYLLMVWLRALRWRHLTDPVREIGVGPLFRATAVGFTANNIFPLRMGEVVRSWYLAREVGASAGAILGTVALERVLDMIAVVVLALVAIALSGLSEDADLARRAWLLVPVAVVPTAVLVALRLAPARSLALAEWLLRPFPERLSGMATRLVRTFTEGLGALRGGRHLFWLGLHTLSIWLVAGVLPILGGFWALGVDMGSARETLVAAWLTLAAIGVAVALPSAPGFFGPYHFACKTALVRFGVAPELAVALGTLTHAVFWVFLTGLGFAVLRVRRTTLGETLDVPEASSPR